MLQIIYCNVKSCGYNSENGFCLNRLTVINEQGVCDFLTKPNWNQKIDSKRFNIYEEFENAEAAKEIGNNESSEKEERDGPPHES